jgi:hypothetical protein
LSDSLNLEPAAGGVFFESQLHSFEAFETPPKPNGCLGKAQEVDYI